MGQVPISPLPLPSLAYSSAAGSGHLDRTIFGGGDSPGSLPTFGYPGGYGSEGL